MSERLAIAVWRAPEVDASSCVERITAEWASVALDAVTEPDDEPVVEHLTVSVGCDDQGPYTRAPDAHDCTPNVDVLVVVDLVRAHDLDDLPGRDVLHHLARRVEVWRVSTREPKQWERTWALGEPAPGLKMVSFMRRADGIAHEQFVRHWTEQHTPLALEHHPGLWNYRQHVVRRAFTPGGDGIDGIAELHFRSRDDFETRFFASDESKRVVLADVARFMGPPGPDTTLMTETALR